MDKERCRTVLVQGIDKILGYRMFGPSEEQRAVLLAARQLAISDDEFIGKISLSVGPYRQEVTEMAKSVKAVNWQSLLEKLQALAEKAPAIAALVTKLIEQFTDVFNNQPVKSGDCAPPTPEVKAALDAECEALISLCEAHCKLCCMLNCCDE